MEHEWNEQSADMVCALNSQLELPKTIGKLNNTDKLRRLDFCVSNENLCWESVIFSDELVIETNTKGTVWWPMMPNGCLGGTNGREVNWLNKSQMILWGGITADKVLDLVVIKQPWNHTKYIEFVLEPQVKPLVNIYPNMVYQQDNSPVHRAKNVKEWFIKEAINCIDWPSKSWDLNIMEDVWGILKEEIGVISHNSILQNEVLEKIIIDAWHRIQNNQAELLPILYGSIKSRLRSCVVNKGDVSSW